MAEGEGLRYNEGKLRYDLVQADALKGLVEVLTFGAKKYADRNWEKGMAWSKITSSLHRHLAAIERGEDYDPETGLLHADHVQCNAHFLAAYYRIFPEGDDRPHSYLKPKKIGLDIDGVLADFIGAVQTKFPDTPTPVYWREFQLDRAFEQVKTDKEFWLNIKPLINPRSIPFDPHCYITSRTIDTATTTEWLEKFGFPKAPVYTVGHENSKVEVAKKSGIDWFVDDAYKNFTELNAGGICTYLYTAPHNVKYDVGHKRIDSLSELVTR